METLTWGAFKSKLLENSELHLHFKYDVDEFVKASFHITEIKLASITSVDCGGVLNKWDEVIVQLWEPEKPAERSMKVEKALSIINTVESKLTLNPDAVVKVEFGNDELDARLMYPAEFLIDGGNFIITLSPDFTQCKATGRGQTCGDEKPKKQLINLTQAGSACCTPGAGCC